MWGLDQADFWMFLVFRVRTTKNKILINKREKKNRKHSFAFSFCQGKRNFNIFYFLNYSKCNVKT